MPLIKAAHEPRQERAPHLPAAGTESRRARALRALHRRHARLRAESLIEATLAKDREFVAWRAEQPAGAVVQPATRAAAGAARRRDEPTPRERGRRCAP